MIDFVVSDHSPSIVDLKRLDDGDFCMAWGGISSLQLGLSLVWTEGRRRDHSLDQVVRWMAARPAEVVGVAGKGSIAVGQDADLVVFAPDEAYTVDVEVLHHRNAVSPYHGRTLQGLVRATYLRGERVIEDAPHGKLLTSNRR